MVKDDTRKTVLSDDFHKDRQSSVKDAGNLVCGNIFW